MTEKNVKKEDVLASVKKDSTERLVNELQTCYPSAIAAELKEFSREEIVDKVVECRLCCQTTGRVQENLEGRLSMILKKEAAEKKPEVVSLLGEPGMDPMMAML